MENKIEVGGFTIVDRRKNKINKAIEKDLINIIDDDESWNENNHVCFGKVRDIGTQEKTIRNNN